MGIYQVSIKKQAHHHKWVNTYVIVIDTPCSHDELEYVADAVSPALITFERIFLSEEVEITHAETTPVCEPAEAWIAWRAGVNAATYGQGVPGLRPMAIEESMGPAITLLLGLQPVVNHWGRKDYRYALHRDDVNATIHGYQLRPEAREAIEARLAQAKASIKTLLQGDATIPSLAVSASTNAHLIETYRYRRVRNITIKGVHIKKHRRR